MRLSLRKTTLLLACSAVATAAFPPHSALAQQRSRSDSAFVTQIEFKTSGTVVRGTIHVAAGAGPHRTIVRLQGFPGSDDTSFEKFAQAHGMNGVSIHFRGQVSSDGIYRISGTADDATAAVAFLRSSDARDLYRIDPARISLLGSSAGTWATLKATAADSTLRCVAAIVPFNWAVAGVAARTDAVRRQRYESTMARFSSNAQGPVRLDTTFVSVLLRDAELFDLQEAASGLRGRHVYLVGAANDQTAPLDTHFYPLSAALRAMPGTELRDTVVNDSHNLPDTYMEVFAGIVRWVNENCDAAR
jgi:cephalosporin-C deacetylase-like acetyl esterase